MCLSNYLSVIALQVLTQIASAPCTAGSQFAVSLSCNMTAFLTTVAFLDWKIKAACSYGQGTNETPIEKVLYKV
jgi:hypothetical protein